MDSIPFLHIAPFPPDLAGRMRQAISGSGVASSVTIYGFESLTSTMDISSAFAAGELSEEKLAPFRIAGSGPAKVFLAYSQSKGRGRKDRAWHSAPGMGIYATFLFHTPRQSAELGGLSLAVGLAVQDALTFFQVPSSLKWPNDVLAGSAAGDGKRKLAGILVDVGSSKLAPQNRAVHVGVGMNLRQQDFPSGISAVSLDKILGRELLYEEAFAALAAKILSRVESFWMTGFSSFAAEWNERSGQVGEPASIEMPGGALAEGRVLGVDAGGGLRLLEQGTGKEITIYSGELR